MTRIMAGLVALSLTAAIAGTAAAQNAGVTVLRGTGNQSGGAASAAESVEIVRGSPATRRSAERSGKRTSPTRRFVAAGEPLWLRDARSGGLIACWVSGSGYVGRSVIRCTSG